MVVKRGALHGLVKELMCNNTKAEATALVLEAFRWKPAVKAGFWVPPYNPHIMFKAADALDVCGRGFFLGDMAAGRYDGIKQG